MSTRRKLIPPHLPPVPCRLPYFNFLPRSAMIEAEKHQRPNRGNGNEILDSSRCGDVAGCLRRQ
jgi:hypothetical protein